MAGIEARRLARHPVFLVGVVLAFVVLVLMYVLDDDPHLSDLLSTPVHPGVLHRADQPGRRPRG